jgi:DHA1 family tetracycline resistance protein-like MFS transporter
MAELNNPTDEIPAAGAPSAPPDALWIVLFIVFIDLLGFGIILPQLPFFGAKFHASPVQIGLVFALYSVCQFLAAPVLGLMSDKFGRRPVLVYSQFGSAIGYGLLGVVTQYNFPNLAMGLGLVYLARIIDGVSGGNISTAQAYISDVTTPQTRAKGMGLLGAAFGLGFAVGPILAGVIGNNTNRAAWPAYTAAILSFTAMLLSAFRLPESRSRRPANEEVWLHPSKFLPILRKPVLFQLLLLGFFAMTAFTMLEGTIGLYLAKRFTYGPHHTPYGMREVSWYFAYIGVFIMYVQGRLMGQMVKRFGEWTVSITGAVLVAVAMSVYVISGYDSVLPVLLIAGAINATGRSLQQPPISSLISKISDRSEQGTVFGLYQGLGSIGRSLGPIIATAAFAIHDTAQFMISGIMMAIAAGWLVKLRGMSNAQPRGFEVAPSAPPAPSAEVA